MQNYFLYIKYYYYFFFFIQKILKTYFLFKKNNYINENIIKEIHYYANKSGCLIIKIIQMVNKLIEIIDDKNKYEFINIIFNNFYENCHIHPLNYTQSIFNKELTLDFNDNIQILNEYNIKSGSIAQVYKAKIKTDVFNTQYKDIAIKVVHPNTNIQLNYIYSFVLLYDYFFTRFYFKHTIFNIIDIKTIYNDVIIQNDMNIEFENLSYYYNVYKDNNYIYIPKPIFSTQNILFMEYVESIDINQLDYNINNQKQLSETLHNLTAFMYDNYMFLDKIHPDLHEYNWKIKADNYDVIVIYDFGLILNKKNINNIAILKESFKKLLLEKDCNNLTKLIVQSLDFLDVSKHKYHYDKDLIINDIINYIIEKKKQNKIFNFERFLFEYLTFNNFRISLFYFYFLITCCMVKKQLYKYIYPLSINNPENIFTLYTQRVNYYKKNNIFNNVVNFYETYFINNDYFLENVNNYAKLIEFDNLNNDFKNHDNNKNNIDI